MKWTMLALFALTTQALAIDWQGHRGARGLYPENTIEGMKEALKYPVTTLELDVVVSKDNQVVVSHEPWMSAEICTHPDGKEIKGEELNLYAMTHEEILRFDCGSKLHPRFTQQRKAVEGKPLLSRLIRETLQGTSRISYNIEIKSTPEDEKRGYQPDIKTFSELVVKTIREQLPLERFTIQSFDWRVLKYLHAAHPEVRLVALREEAYSAKDVLTELGFSPAVFSPYYKLLNKEDIAYFHAQKIQLIPWTVNTVEDMKALIALGVDGIITDYPNLISEAQEKGCPKGESRFENKCVKVPKHARPSKDNPGWECEASFVQKRNSCIKIAVPANARLSDDGKNWECLEGYVRYRSSCKKP